MLNKVPPPLSCNSRAVSVAVLCGHTRRPVGVLACPDLNAHAHRSPQRGDVVASSSLERAGVFTTRDGWCVLKRRDILDDFHGARGAQYTTYATGEQCSSGDHCSGCLHRRPAGHISCDIRHHSHYKMHQGTREAQGTTCMYVRETCMYSAPIMHSNCDVIPAFRCSNIFQQHHLQCQLSRGGGGPN